MKRIADLAVILCILAIMGTAFVRRPEGEYVLNLWKVFQEEGLEAAIAKFKADFNKPPETQKPPKAEQPSPKTEDPSQTAKLIAEDTQTLYRLINETRESLGISRLEVDEKLAEMALYRAKLLADLGELTHDIPGEGKPSATAKKYNYSFRVIGENLTAYYSDERGDRAHKTLLNSKPHYENMTSPEYTKMGVGIAVAKDGMRYVCELFATPR